ncbi:ribose 5-phosphate isomerase B [Sphaerotilus sulfidivorans]|uniref:Ribose 5-phosphate isomerase B n=1 Tax=Sphaerotilus sulfidivorans TaxID=639200 RepID=A0A5C1Q6S0_9BURK|nr:RpiB/LacA/LacB family sugar-phosphate isomerase [Sphaerotilus sulfidivorans]MCK6403507.1 RpiB/LacA/LacB family sugar-phosphate isomerase [Sphaerotilus sulfidivorans]NZD45976.1 RpiB/LacA/LacB family sugar-phosphate isomerase [Sphaerotilus sulfidivorans]QEN03058.1 RpiB/LacA/LacB family sugar-phosphate isomerase [Sphaerotilus sulfidivorans]
MKIAIGCDEAAWDMKQAIGAELRRQGHEVIDHGTHDGAPVLYPDIAVAVAEGVARGEAERGLLFCGTGIGMAISANKVPGIRAAQAHDTYSAERASKSNDAQIITIGARVVGLELAKAIVQAFIGSRFEPRSLPKIEALAAHETRLRGSAC